VLFVFVIHVAHFTSLVCLLWRILRGVPSGAFHIISLLLVARFAWGHAGVVELVLTVVLYISCVKLKILATFYIYKFTAR
jgi:hypothetical protein